MSRRVLAAVAAAALGVGVLAGGARAQAPAQHDDAAMEAAFTEMNCIYDGLSDEQAGMLFDNYLAPDAAEVKTIDAAVDALQTSCGATYGWSKEEHNLAEMIGRFGSIVDFAMLDLESAGMKNGADMFNVWDALSDADLRQFLSVDWAKDEAFTARMRTAVIGAGVPNQGDSLNTALIALEAITLANGATEAWLTDKGL